jgi:hypothetical protein
MRKDKGFWQSILSFGRRLATFRCFVVRSSQKFLNMNMTVIESFNISVNILCSVDRASRYNSYKWPTWCTISFFICLFQFSTCFEQPRAHHQENQLYQYIICYVSLCVGDSYQMLYWYNWFSWWWAWGYLKHAENWNKHIEKRIVRQVCHLQESNKGLLLRWAEQLQKFYVNNSCIPLQSLQSCRQVTKNLPLKPVHDKVVEFRNMERLLYISLVWCFCNNTNLQF